MKEIQSERDEMIDDIVEMLLHHVTVTDPHTISALHDMQRSHFINMQGEVIKSVHTRLKSYTPSMRRNAAMLLSTAERNRSMSYSSWITGHGESELSDAVVRNCIYVIPILEAVSIPVVSIGNESSKALTFIVDDWENQSDDEFLGWAIWSAVDNRIKPLPSREDLEWVGQHAAQLLPHLPRLLELGTAQREVCETFLNGHTSLSSGVL